MHNTRLSSILFFVTVLKSRLEWDQELEFMTLKDFVIYQVIQNLNQNLTLG